LNRVLTILTAAAITAAAPWAGALAAEHQVKMLNKDSQGIVMQFEPAFLKIAPGDSVKFLVTDKGHNAESILDLMPEGAEPFKGKINEEISVTFTEEGVYGVKCQPHFALGMVALIQVGENPANLDASATAKLPGKAKTRMAELVAQVGAAPAN
jgi:pseudoazurin